MQVPRNVVLTCIGAPVQTSGSSYLWYYVRYNNLAGYIRGDFVRVCDQNGNPLGEATAAPSVTATPAVYSDENRCQPACFPRGQVAGTV